VSLQVYDDFGKVGYSLTDYNEKWMTPNGLGEMAVEDARSFSGGCFHLSAVPFQTGSDVPDLGLTPPSRRRGRSTRPDGCRDSRLVS
jgi:hypothetical protein